MLNPIHSLSIIITVIAIFAGGASAQMPPAVPDLPAERAATPLSAQQRGYTGFGIRVSAGMRPDGTVVTNYPVVSTIQQGSPAQKAGLRVDDVILEVNGKDAREEGTLLLRAGIRYTLRIRRGDREHEALLVPGPRPIDANSPRP